MVDSDDDKPPPLKRIGHVLGITRSKGDTPVLPFTNDSSQTNPRAVDGKFTDGASQAARKHPNANLDDAEPSSSSQPESSSNTERDEAQSSSLESPEDKGSIFNQICRTIWMIIRSSWINWLLLFVPVGIVLGALHKNQGEKSPINPTVIFAINSIAIIPLAGLLGFATESVAGKMGDKVGALLNVTFGNAVELIIFIIALIAKEVRIVQASILGSLLANLLLILGMCFVSGGLRFREQLYNPAITQMSACLLSLSVMSLLLPTAFHASFDNMAKADEVVLKVSRGSSVILLLVYALYLFFQLKSHAYIYESTPQHRIDEESHPGLLADMLHSSSSSDSSSSSSSDTDSTERSNKTASRIRRALKRKDRRKSNSSSKKEKAMSENHTLSRTASGGSGSIKIATAVEETTELSSLPKIRSIDTVCSGDEADNDESNNGINKRDFGAAVKPSKKRSKAPKPESGEKSEAKATVHGISQNRKTDLSTESTEKGLQPDRRVGFATEANEIAPAPKRPFNIRTLSSNLPRIMPNLQPRQTTNSEASAQLRRTTSLPDRLNTRSTNSAPSIQPLPHLMPIPKSDDNDPESVLDGKPHLSRVSAVILLLVSTALVAACAEFLVESIDYMVKNTHVSQAFIGLIILPIVGNAAEHVTAVAVASKNKMDLAIGVALGSSIQIALFVTPVIVLLGWCLNTDMSLYFSLFETVSLFASAFIVNYLVLDGRSNYLEGTLLIAAYVIIAVAAFFYPSCEELSSASGPHGATTC